MEHIAIDLGGRESQICVRNERGKILKEQRSATSDLRRIFKDRPSSRVVLETCSEAFTVAEWARAEGHEVRLVAASSVRALGVGSRKIKTDVRDAQVLSDVSTKVDLASVHIPSELARERRARCTAREALVQSRTALVNSVRGFLRQRVVHVRCTPVTLPRKVRALLLQTSEGIPSFLEHLLRAIEALTEQIAQADEELTVLAQQDPVCKLLMSVPGVGAVTATRFAAAVDDPTRFKSAEQVGSYLGLTPGENTTGFKPKRIGITKAGPASVRRTLTQAAWVLWRWRPDDPMVAWARGLAERKGKAKAITALTRKLATVLFAMWRNNKPYDPKHLEKQRDASSAA